KCQLKYIVDIYFRCHFYRRCFFVFNDTATTEIYTLSLHDALPISQKLTLSDISDESKNYLDKAGITTACLRIKSKTSSSNSCLRSEERFSRNAETDLVCRLLLEKKKNDPKIAVKRTRTKSLIIAKS